MKKTDIPGSGSEHIKQSRIAINYMAECVESFIDILNTNLIFGRKKSDDELSFALSLIHNLKYELLKIRSCVKGYIEMEAVNSLVLMVRRSELSNSLRGMYLGKSLGRHTDIIGRSIFCRKLHNAYILCKDSINACRISSGIITDYKRITWSNKDILVGSLRNRQQLDVALGSRFYHVPAHMISEDSLSVSYIAIYQSKNLFAGDAGIRYFGKVLSVDKVVRKNIREIPSNSEELYYVFNVGRWHSLDRPVKADRGGNLLNFTNLYMLLRAEIVDELYFTDEREYKLYSSIKVSLRRGYNKVATSYGNGVIAIDDGVISVYKNNTPVYSVSVSDYENNPVGRFRLILKCCK